MDVRKRYPGLDSHPDLIEWLREVASAFFTVVSSEGR
jgi:hypothetical protein